MKDKCDGNCASCSQGQMQYCNVQMAKNIQNMIAEILTIIKSMNEKKEESFISINDKDNNDSNE